MADPRGGADQQLEPDRDLDARSIRPGQVRALGFGKDAGAGLTVRRFGQKTDSSRRGTTLPARAGQELGFGPAADALLHFHRVVGTLRNAAMVSEA